MGVGEVRCGDFGLARPQHQMVVVSLLAVGQNLRTKTHYGKSKDGRMRCLVGLVHIDRLAPVSARGDVVRGAGGFPGEAGGTWGGVWVKGGQRRGLTLKLPSYWN
jgi:hypothetical protein